MRYIWNHPAVRGERGRALTRYVGWQVWQRTARRPVDVRLAADVRLRCHPHSTSASAVLYCRFPDWSEMRFLLDELRPGDIFIDVGANVGVYTLLAASVPGVRCISFEPSTESRGRLLDNVRRNNLNQVEVHPKAVGDHRGDVLFTVGRGTINKIADATTSGSVERVPVVTLDDHIPASGRVALVKIDVEGAEPAVLRGATRLLQTHAPALLIERNDSQLLGRLLETAGYHTVRYIPETRALVPVDLTTEKSQNILAVKTSAPGEAVNGVSVSAAAGVRVTTTGQAKPDPAKQDEPAPHREVRSVRHD